RPHELTHQFITSAGAQRHRVPWFDEDLTPPAMGPPPSHRLWRLFAFLESGDRAAGVSQRGRTPGKTNINTIWEQEVFQALCDAAAGNFFTTGDVATMWDNLLRTRTPGLRNGGSSLSPGDRPFLELAGVGHLPSSDPQTTPPNGGTPIGRGLEDTIFRLQDPTQGLNS